MRAYKFNNGEFINGLEVIDINYSDKMAQMKCHCGNIFVAGRGNLWSGGTKSCGCLVIKSNGYLRYNTPHKKELGAFKRMHDRVRDRLSYKGIKIQWDRTPEGFKKFFAHIGNIPSNLVKPSLGRKIHSLGYVEGNIMWEEHSLNSKKRRGTRYES